MKKGKSIVVFTVMLVFGGCLEGTSYVTEDKGDRVGRHLLERPPQYIQHSLDAVFEDKIILLGYDLNKKEVRRGDSFRVTWYWQCVKALGPRWRLFTHASGPNDNSKLNLDNAGPIRKKYQPEHWRAGTVVRDEQWIRVPEDWESKLFGLRVGIWRDGHGLLWRSSRRLQPRGKSVGKEHTVVGPQIVVLPGRMSVQVSYAEEAPIIDGAFEDEAVWRHAPRLGHFRHTMSGRPAARATEVRLLWDDEYLYVAMRAEDGHLESRYRNHDDELWHEDAFEVFLDPKADALKYYELQVNPAGVVFDSYLPTYRKNQNDWTSNAVVKVQMQGDLGDDREDDKGWIAELAIPFSALQVEETVPPKAGDKWRANFFRIDKMEKKKDFGAWSPPMRGDFHALDKFGELIFVKPEAGEKAAQAEASAAEESPNAKGKSQKDEQQAPISK